MRTLLLILALFLTSCAARMGVTSVIHRDGTVMSGESEKPKIVGDALVLEKDGVIVIVPLSSVWEAYWFEGEPEDVEPIIRGRQLGMRD